MIPRHSRNLAPLLLFFNALVKLPVRQPRTVGRYLLVGGLVVIDLNGMGS